MLYCVSFRMFGGTVILRLIIVATNLQKLLPFIIYTDHLHWWCGYYCIAMSSFTLFSSRS